MQAPKTFMQKAVETYSADYCPSRDYDSNEPPTLDKSQFQKWILPFKKEKSEDSDWSPKKKQIRARDLAQFNIQLKDVEEHINSKLNTLPDLLDFDFERIMNSANQIGASVSGMLRIHIDSFYKQEQEEDVKNIFDFICAYRVYYCYLARFEENLYKKIDIIEAINRMYRAQKLCETYKENYKNLHYYGGLAS